MNREPNDLSDVERVVIQVVASLPYLINEVPRPYSLEFFVEISGVGKKKINSALTKLELLGVLTEDPDRAIRRATSFLPMALDGPDETDFPSSF